VSGSLLIYSENVGIMTMDALFYLFIIKSYTEYKKAKRKKIT